MREIRIYQPGDYDRGQQLLLSPEAAHHVAVVLRRQVGDVLTLFCGDNREFEACIEAIKKKQVVVRLNFVKEKNRESSLRIHLAQALSKGERMDLVVQKSVELGVASITPLITAHCAIKWDQERMEKKRQLWQAIAIAACEQSGRNQIPELHPFVSFTEYLRGVQAKLRLILDPQVQATWRDYSLKEADMVLMIGPEGGFSEEEKAWASQHQFSPLSLGPRILRTETAAITALSVLQAVGGDL